MEMVSSLRKKDTMNLLSMSMGLSVSRRAMNRSTLLSRPCLHGGGVGRGGVGGGGVGGGGVG